ncbi:MAG: acyl-CoA dehydrogenase family protein [Jatrophihabitantaceae bacterium]
MAAAGQVYAAAQVLARRIRDRGAEIEQAGNLPADIVAALRAAGVFRLWMPIELGGYEATPAEVLRVVQLLAAADGSAGWCVATGVASNIAGALLPEPTAREIFADSTVLCGGALMPGGRAVSRPGGGYLVNGRWSFGSGTQHCDWVIGAAQVVEDAGDRPPRTIAVLMPAAAVKFLPTWQVIGLEGTGSVDYEASGLPVPAEHCIELGQLRPWPAGAMWRIPLRSLLYPILGAVPLGIAQRALQELLAVGDRVRYGSASRLADREAAQLAVGRAEAAIGAASSYLSDCLHRLYEVASAGQVPSAADRAAARAAAAQAAEQAVAVVTLCYQTAGTVAMYRQHPLQRALRDVLAAVQHFALSAQGFSIAGRVAFGLEPDPML